MIFVYWTITIYGTPFQGVLTNQTSISILLLGHSNASGMLQTLSSYNPPIKIRVWALPFSLATTKGMNIHFLFLRLLRCFTSAGSLRAENGTVVQFEAALGFPIRKSSDQRLLATSPRLIAGTPRPSSPQSPEASTIRP